MALIIETGAGIAGADSYQTVAQLDAYALAFFGAALTGTDGEKEAALRRSAAFMNSLPFKAVRTKGRAQGLAWPRDGVTDDEGNEIEADKVPQEVKNAQLIFARAELQSPGILTPTVVQNEGIKRERVGPIETEFADTSKRVEAFRPIVTQAMDIIEGLLQRKGPSYFLERV